jgi:hypothetical protein
MKLANDALTTKRSSVSWTRENALTSVDIGLVVSIIELEFVGQRISVEGKARSISQRITNAACQTHCPDTGRVVFPTAVFGFALISVAMLSSSVYVIGLIGCYLIKHYLKAVFRHMNSPLIFALFIFPVLLFFRPLFMNSL